MATLLTWKIDGQLAFGPRPLRWARPGRLDEADGPHVLQWIAAVREQGVNSVICLLDEVQLALYEDLHAESLLGLYRANGLEVAHLPSPDPRGLVGERRDSAAARLDAVKPDAYDAFEALPRAVLVHCSAGMQRSPEVAAYIANRVLDSRGGPRA